MANKKISELSSRTPALSDLMIVGDPSSGYSYKCTITALATIIETDIADGYVTIGTTQTISGAKTFSNNLTLTSVANAATTQTKFLTLNGSNVVNYRTGAEVLSDIGGQASLSGTGLVKSTSGTISYITDNSSNWNTAYNDSIVSAAVSGTTTKTLTLTQQDGGTLTASWSDLNTDAVTSVFGRTGAVVATEGDYSLNLLSDVTLTSPSNGQVLKYNGTAWVNDTDANTGTVTSVGLSSATSGVTIGSTPITTSGTITLAIATASGSQQGLLSSTDWTTFNNKQNTLTLTTTGTSGAATLVGSTLNIPQYQAALTNPVTGTGTTNYIPKFTSSSAIGNSIMQESGSVIDIAGSLRLSGTGYLGFGGGTNYIEGDNPNNILKFATSNSERMRLDASGNLIVGGTSAVYSASGRGVITINGSSQSLLGFTVSGADKGFLYHTGTDMTLSNTANGFISFQTNNTERARIDASGNLGLGVSPSAWSILRGLQNGRANLVGYVSNAEGAWLTNNAFYNGTSWTYQTSAQATMYQQLSGVQSWHIAGSGTAGNAISFTQAMTLDASGNLGIGSTSPGGSSTDRFTTIQGSSSATLQVIKTSDITGQLFAGSGQVGLFATTNHPITFGTNNTERMRITSGGNVGIGTTSPTSYSGFTTLNINNATNGGVIDLLNNGTRVATFFNTSTDVNFGSITNVPLLFYTNNTERMRITSGGNLLVGTTTDIGDKMYVNGSIRIPSAFFFRYDGDTGLIGSGTSITGGTASQLGIRAANDILFATNGANERMRITSGGELLINTTSDAGDYKLQVNGNIYNSVSQGAIQFWSNSNNPSINIRANTGYNAILAFTQEGVADRWSIGTKSADATLYFSTGDALGSTKATLSSGGNLELTGSIKTAAPSGGNAAAWKLGERVASSSLTLNTTQYIQLDINGTLYTLATVNLS